MAKKGAYAEGKVREMLKKLKAESMNFDFQRQYDSHSSRGRIPPQCGDYLFFNGEHGVIEVKEVEHNYRIPLKNFGKTEIPMMYLRQKAGAAICILIAHRVDGKTFWRAPSFDWVYECRDLPSLDLRDHPTFATVKDAFTTAWRNASL